MTELKKQIVSATKWSSITELTAKLIAPITGIVLARLLTPDAFGVVTTIMMILSFVEIFTDAGFQKYLVQHEFRDKKDREQSATVAFWCNMLFSLVIWGFIILFREPIARIIGNPGLGHVIAISCVCIPLLAFSSIQMALYKRDFDFKTLFRVRMIALLVPLFITIPLAFFLRSYWALIAGTIATYMVNAVFLTIYSSWRPNFYFSFGKLKEMFSFSVWSMVEQMSIWLTGYLDIFIISAYLSMSYLGLYKVSMTTVGQIIGIITAATTPVLFSSLSRLQNDKLQFEDVFFKFQKYVSLFIFPIGVAIYSYSDLITKILLGEQWMEASPFIGLWGLTSAITIVFSHYSSEIYRSVGRPKLSVLAQWLHIVVLCPAVMVAVKYGFEILYIVRSLVRFELIAVNFIILYVALRFPIQKMILNVFPSMSAAIVMGVLAYFFRVVINETILNLIVSCAVCFCLYILVISIFPRERVLLKNIIRRVKFNL